MTLRQEKDLSGDITFDSDHTWEAYGSNKTKLKQKKKDRGSHRLGSSKKESRQPHRLGSASDGFGEASNSSFALDDGGGFSDDWKSFTEDRGWNEMDRQQAKAWKTAQSELNMTQGDGRRGPVSRPNSSSSSLDFHDFQEEPQPALKVHPPIGVRRGERSASTRMVPKEKVNSSATNEPAGGEKVARRISPTSSRGISPLAPQRGVRRHKSIDLQNLQLHGAKKPTRVRTRRRTSLAAGFSLENNDGGLDTSGRGVPQRTKSMDVDRPVTSDLGFGVDGVDVDAIGSGEKLRVRSRRRASLAVGATPSPNVQDLRPDRGQSEAMRMRSRRRASLAVNATPDNPIQNSQLDTPNETPRVRTRRRVSIAANDANMDRRRGVQRTKSMDVDMRGSGDSRPGLLDSGQGSHRTSRNVRRINSTDFQEMSFRNANRLGNELAVGITDERDIPPTSQQSQSPRSRSPRMRMKDGSKNLNESADREKKLSPRSRRRLNIQRINSVDSASSCKDRDIQGALRNDAKSSGSPTTSRRTDKGYRRRGIHRVNSNGLQDLISGLHSKKKTAMEAELIVQENQASETDKSSPEGLQTHSEDQESMTARQSPVWNDSSSISNSSTTNGDLRKTTSRARSARLQKHAGTSRSEQESTSNEAGSNSCSSGLNVNIGNSSFNSLRSGMSEQSRPTSNQLSRQRSSDSTRERERATNTSRAHRKRREAPKRGINRSKSSDDSMTFGAWTSGDSSVRSRKKFSKSPPQRKSVDAGDYEGSGPHSRHSDKELLNGEIDTVPPHDKGFIASFLGSS